MYYWNIRYIGRLVRAAWPTLFAYFLLVVFLSIRNSNYLATMTLLYFGIRVAYDQKRKIAAIKNNPSSGPYLELKDNCFSYRERPNGYCVSIPFSSIEKTRHTNILGLTKVTIKLKENKMIAFWNIENSREFVGKLKDLTSKGSG